MFYYIYSSTINQATFCSDYHNNGFRGWMEDGFSYGIYFNSHHPMFSNDETDLEVDYAAMTPADPLHIERCWDCGSTIPGHHTALCAFAAPNDIRDLPSKPGTQYWLYS